VARILIVGGGCRGRQLASRLTSEGHAVRVTTRSESGRAAIEASGAECWIGTPDRLATLRSALENVTIVCWLLASAVGTSEQLRALHGPRLEFFASQTIDTTVRGFVYEAAGSTVPADVLEDGVAALRSLGERNAIPLAFLRGDPGEPAAWVAHACAAVDSLLEGGASGRKTR
jgi:uncharacterized protein YbjT (DUF2867 family)